VDLEIGCILANGRELATLSRRSWIQILVMLHLMTCCSSAGCLFLWSGSGASA